MSADANSHWTCFKLQIAYRFAICGKRGFVQNVRQLQSTLFRMWIGWGNRESLRCPRNVSDQSSFEGHASSDLLVRSRLTIGLILWGLAESKLPCRVRIVFGQPNDVKMHELSRFGHFKLQVQLVYTDCHLHRVLQLARSRTREIHALPAA